MFKSLKNTRNHNDSGCSAGASDVTRTRDLLITSQFLRLFCSDLFVFHDDSVGLFRFILRYSSLFLTAFFQFATNL